MMVPPHGSNRGPIDYKSIALPAELQGHEEFFIMIYNIFKFYFYIDLYDEKLLLHY